ncbi:SMC-Scp complex subunit ScpB [Rhizobium sp. PP-F2F-G48]|uniref:SMC-Scp complex subunit ScpB n=1 Tax=Rhizobium sp. PP-F2F-G48 TaxID=2135651 RepID=UPI00104C9655|nr:SMC-Scp complex subunit ScpB [Rhizobium sp. PP-F2F-G48]
MAGASTGSRCRTGKRDDDRAFDQELEDLPAALRWREWMMRVEAVIFASAEPVTRETLARVVGKDCAIDLLIDNLREDLVGRPYELVSVAGGWQHRTRSVYAETIRASTTQTRSLAAALSQNEATVLMAIAYLQPVTRGELSKTFGKEISRDTIASLRSAGLIASGPRSPTPGAPYTYVTTRHFLSAFGMETLLDLPDVEMLKDAGLMQGRGTDVALTFDSGEEADMDEA